MICRLEIQDKDGPVQWQMALIIISLDNLKKVELSDPGLRQRRDV